MDNPNKPILLIVDDNPTNIKVLFNFLKESGFKVLVAKDGESALSKLQEISPDLVLLDVMMPGIDGFETCRRMKEDPKLKEIPVIFMTALSDTVDKVKGLSLGAVDYITKPFQQEEVLARINLHLKLRSLTLDLAQKNEKLENFNHELERQVEERTAELKRTQSQLVLGEKMSALGQLVAGVAHEINNPVNFIYGNLRYASEYTHGLLELVQKYQEKDPDPGEEIEELIEEIDLEFVNEDLPRLLNSMQIGAERIREIVLSLRNFSRVDEAEFKEADLHAGIDSTLMILHSKTKAKGDDPGIEIIRDYGKLPLVKCYPGQLNQVFMNLLVNAIDALEENRKSERKIEIITQKREKDIEIRITDNAGGIPPEVQDKLFNPFFTTKPVGKGTGLGLAIVHSIIVEKHGGTIECQSQVNDGTAFILRLPVDN
ncbi:response regulator [Spirulina sp. CS-785/01]|uniref:hybrid sensor histidine kinase/response regulator n=1 Tax=Spirulina sp. CS-785/01 TaxID=3021716 RepID=UPI002330A004|nr:response regulator [Spirulina sp. CS-785/01]MDB9315035.1 response regulator [Spirulina sp. CS-785/01]